MTIEVPSTVEQELLRLARSEGRDVRDLVEEALRQFVEAASVSDVAGADVAATQLALTAELRGIGGLDDA